MTTPFYSSNEPVTVGGQTFPLGRWRQIALAAKQAREQNPNDTEAMEALEYATTAVRSYANTLRQRPTLSAADIREAQPGRAAAVGMGAANVMSLTFGDEGAGLVAANLAMLPGGESPKQAYLRARDANRAFDAAAAAHNPASYVGGQALGTLLSLGAGGLVNAAGPLTRTIAAGAVPGATAGARALAMGAGGLIGAGIGGAAAYGSGEEGPIADVQNVPYGAVPGFLFGAAGTGFGNRSIRRERLRVADEQVRAMAPQARQARIDADRELAGLRAAQRQNMESRNAPADPEALIRGKLAQQGFSPELIEKTLAARRAGVVPRPTSTPSQAAAATHTATPTAGGTPLAPGGSASVVAPPTAPTGHRLPSSEVPPMVAGSSYPPPPRDYMAEAQAARANVPPPSAPTLDVERGGIRGRPGQMREVPPEMGPGAMRSIPTDEFTVGKVINDVGLQPGSGSALVRRARELVGDDVFRARVEQHFDELGEPLASLEPSEIAAEVLAVARGVTRGGSVTAQQIAQATTRNAARNAFNAVPEEFGLEAQKEAARRGAAMASEGATVAEPASLMAELEASAAINNILAQAPSQANRTSLLLALRNLSEAQRQTVVRQLPSAWKAALGIP